MTLTPTSITAQLDNKTAAHFARIQQSPAFRTIEDPSTPLALALAIVKHTLLEVSPMAPTSASAGSGSL